MQLVKYAQSYNILNQRKTRPSGNYAREVWSGLVWSGLVWSGLVWSGLDHWEGSILNFAFDLFWKQHYQCLQLWQWRSQNLATKVAMDKKEDKEWRCKGKDFKETHLADKDDERRYFSSSGCLNLTTRQIVQFFMAWGSNLISKHTAGWFQYSMLLGS